jgi:hypothetical protein
MKNNIGNNNNRPIPERTLSKIFLRIINHFFKKGSFKNATKEPDP